MSSSRVFSSILKKTHKQTERQPSFQGRTKPAFPCHLAQCMYTTIRLLKATPEPWVYMIRGGTQDAATSKERTPRSIWRKREKKNKDITILLPLEHLFHSRGRWEEGGHPKIGSSNSANPKIHEVSRSIQFILPSSDVREMKAGGTNIVLLLHRGPFSLIHLSHLKTFISILQSNTLPFAETSQMQKLRLKELSIHTNY